MNLYEYQGREILKNFSIFVPNGIIVSSPEEAVKAAKILFKKTKNKSLVIKSQIHAGGRGKSGGIQIVKNINDVYKKSKNILGKYLVTPQTPKKGLIVKKILLSEDIYSESYLNDKKLIKEYYLSIMLNRNIKKNIVICSKEGGVNIEEISENPKKLYIEEINPILGLQIFQIKKIGFFLEMYNNELLKNFYFFLKNLYKAYTYINSTLIEINPFIKTFNNEIIPVDVKITLDDNAIPRIKNYLYKLNITHKKNKNFNFIKLKGNVGCMVNGAGLAMATMDMIKSCGGEPANFLDIGGSADENIVKESFLLILKDKSVKVILINIYGGIVRCDTVVKGILESCKINCPINIPIIFRLKGTNEKNAKDFISRTNYISSIYITDTLKDSSNKIREILYNY
ncbi:ADP-forming succinate--CoA ligase subunit beta [Blattabacterium cuenoti]|uniref:ADP-forming succinate--CoA ligase subunit beta n=1 Tax=Blattabacterium cuenoti TaxID=1653831 RepID=UPI00163C19AF|nr:ADP-forming succinate--CoA ligase subunit beta [Blattabacterium cuenoti]